MRLIPAIDIRGGATVRLYQGDFDRERRYDAPPAELAARYATAGARRVHVVDLDGAKTGTDAQHDLIGRLAASVDAAVQVGGGIRTSAQIRRLLEAGIDRVVIGSRAVTDPEQTRRWFGEFGGERIVLAIDVGIDGDGVPMAQTHGWTRASEQSLWDVVEAFLDAGLLHVLCTDVSLDGTLDGPNDALYRRCVERYPAVRWQASGGVGSAADLDTLRATGADGAIVGRALLDGRIPLDADLFR